MSSTGKRACESGGRLDRTGAIGRHGGFTLLEMLVVLLLLAIAYALTPPMFSSGLSTTELKSAARQLAAGLRKTRSHAIVTRREATLSVDVDAHRFQLTGDKKSYPLPARAEVTVFTAKSETNAEQSAAIRFFPDGSSTGGRITLAAGERKFLVDVDWLTGLVEIRDPP
jgi:general secretion pathway protein H